LTTHGISLEHTLSCLNHFYPKAQFAIVSKASLDSIDMWFLTSLLHMSLIGSILYNLKASTSYMYNSLLCFRQYRLKALTFRIRYMEDWEAAFSNTDRSFLKCPQIIIKAITTKQSLSSRVRTT